MASIPTEGSKVYISVDGNSYTEVAQLLSVTPPSIKVDAVETTLLTDSAKTFRPTQQVGPAEFKFKIQYDPNLANHQTLTSLVNTPATRWWRFEYNDPLTNSARDTFQGIITSWDPGTNEGTGNNEVDITIQITGATTRTAGS